MQRLGLLGFALLLYVSMANSDDNPFMRVPGGTFRSALPLGKQYDVQVRSFLLERHPVTNGEFLAFVTDHPEWRRGAVPEVMAGVDYLGAWAAPLDPGPNAAADRPVTQVSWFAAEAYCEAQHARLPDWYEWELAAAASAGERDARSHAAWRQQVLDWYARPAGGALPPVARRPANLYGLYDMHGLVWEWVHDFNSLLPAGADPQKFCGSGALDIQQKDDYAVLMRIAMLGSLHATDTGRIVGFRCARDGGASP